MKEKQASNGENMIRRVNLLEYIKNSPFLSEAYDYAEKAHKGQARAEGTPYFTHCVDVAKIIYEEWGITDETMIAAALLHDTVEDTNVTLKDLSVKFGGEVAFLVDGVSKFRSEKSNGKSKEEKDRETVRKVFDKNLIDPRVGILKLADRLHNMRTLNFMPRDKQIAKAKETEGYARLAESLGMWDVMVELENLSMKYGNPQDFEKYSKIINSDKRTSPEFVAWFTSTLENIAQNSSIEAKVEPQIISLSKLKNKMGKYIAEKINDLISFRIIIPEGGETETRNKVYQMLGNIRHHFAQMEDPKRFTDSHSIPEANGFRGIQATFDFPVGSVEVVITAHDNFNKWGVVSLIRNGEKELQDYALKLVFTKTQEIKFFRSSATGLDFAYSISPEMGARAVAVKIDGFRHPITTVLPNGCEVEIIIGESRIAPEPGCENYCLPSTKRIIQEQRSEESRIGFETKGMEIVREIMADRGLIDLTDLLKMDRFKSHLEQLLFISGCKNSVDSLYYKIGIGVMDTNTFIKLLDDAKITKESLGLTSILIEGHDGPGITNLISSEVSSLGGNIGPMENRPHGISGGTFCMRMVIENLNGKSERELAEFMRKDPRITKVVVV